MTYQQDDNTNITQAFSRASSNFASYPFDFAPSAEFTLSEANVLRTGQGKPRRSRTAVLSSGRIRQLSLIPE
ncbi:MAG: hypothetical protein HYX80_05045 [Chloroflexi bacterium]|nr:hypothetical protein [Chloroflexota bacterium]